MDFSNLGLATELLSNLSRKGYRQPTPIQAQAIPGILSGYDILAAAQTGTGKTAAYTLPILHQLLKEGSTKALQVHTLILAPTRELAIQIHDNVKDYSQSLSLDIGLAYGGVSIEPQRKKLKQGVDILIATPGRLLDLSRQSAIDFTVLKTLVLDEADRMLDLGFSHDLNRILEILPSRRQNLLFSATFSKPIRALAKQFLKNPKEITVNTRNSTAKTVKQWIHPVDKKEKAALLTSLFQQNQWRQALIFTKTKKGANQLTHHLKEYGFNARSIHGDKTQTERIKALNAFKSGRAHILIATDVAARGLDINELPLVVNFDLPTVSEDYVHRIGRTGRAGSKGTAFSLVCADEIDILREIESLIGRELSREFVSGFEPNHHLPDSRPLPTKKKRKAAKPTHKNKSQKSLPAPKQANKKPKKNTISSKTGRSALDFSKRPKK